MFGVVATLVLLAIQLVSEAGAFADGRHVITRRIIEMIRGPEDEEPGGGVPFHRGVDDDDEEKGRISDRSSDPEATALLLKIAGGRAKRNGAGGASAAAAAGTRTRLTCVNSTCTEELDEGNDEKTEMSKEDTATATAAAAAETGNAEAAEAEGGGDDDPARAEIALVSGARAAAMLGLHVGPRLVHKGDQTTLDANGKIKRTRNWCADPRATFGKLGGKAAMLKELWGVFEKSREAVDAGAHDDNPWFKPWKTESKGRRGSPDFMQHHAHRVFDKSRVCRRVPQCGRDPAKFADLWGMNPREMKAPPPASHRKRVHKRVLDLLTGQPVMSRLLSPVLQGAHRGKTVVVAAVNLGYTDMLLNWVLSARVAGADLSNLLIVAADEYAYSMAGCAGLTALYDPITFGTKFPTKDSGFAQGGFADMPVNRPLAPHLRPQLLCI